MGRDPGVSDSDITVHTCPSTRCSGAGDTEHAVEDHNEIRDAVRSVAGHELGTEAWWEAFREAREATVDHLGEEERDVLPPFEEQVSTKRRTDLGMRWMAFHDGHPQAKGLSGEDVDPKQYVEQNDRAAGRSQQGQHSDA